MPTFKGDSALPCAKRSFHHAVQEAWRQLGLDLDLFGKENLSLFRNVHCVAVRQPYAATWGMRRLAVPTKICIRPHTAHIRGAQEVSALTFVAKCM